VPCDLLLVGEAPGAVEERELRPFVGDAGRVLNGLLKDVGLSREQVRITNIVHCRPPGNRKPEDEELLACAVHMAAELGQVKPKLVVALGGTAAKALTGKEKIGAGRGRVLALKPEYRSSIPVVVTYHPAYYLHRNGDKSILDGIATDFRFALKVADALVTVPVKGAAAKQDILVTENEVEIASALRQLASCDLLACDCEWEVLPNGRFQPWSRCEGKAPRLVSIALAGRLADGPLAVAVKADSKAFPVVVKILSKVPTIYHNAPADLAWLLSLGAKPILAGDTLLLASLLNLQHSLGLKVLAAVLTEVPAGWDTEVQEGILGTLPATKAAWDALLKYNGQDALATLLLNERLLQMVREQQREAVLPLYRKLLGASYALVKAALRGAPLDGKMLSELKEQADYRIVSLRKAVAAEFGMPGFVKKEAHSSDLVAAELEHRGVKLPKTPKLQRASLNAAALLPYASRPDVKPLIALAKVVKLENTYLGPWTELLKEQGEARLHTGYKLWVARTGRSSTEGEAGGTIQQFPRDSQMRRLVRAPDGYVIVSADQSQVELRIAAWLADETTMKRFFREGIDIHTATAAWLKASSRGIPLISYLAHQREYMEEVTKEERQGAKPINFGLLYGGQEEVLVGVALRDYGITLTKEQATVAKSGFFELYPKLVDWHKSAWHWVNKGAVPTPLGRWRNLPSEDGEDGLAKQRKAINTPVQATASDLCLISLAEIDRLLDGLDSYIIGFVHDSVLLEASERHLAQVVEVVRRCMENPDLSEFGLTLPVPLVADIKVGKTWGDCA